MIEDEEFFALMVLMSISCITPLLIIFIITVYHIFH